MAFNKEEYWKNKAENVGRVRNAKARQIAPSGSNVEFDNGQLVVKNRAYRRRNRETNLYRRKGFIEYLNAIRIKRLKHGKVTYKYVKLKTKGVE